MIESYLEPSDQNLWLEYNELLCRGRRKQALDQLDELITLMQMYPQEKRRAWIEEVCEALWDRNEEYPIPHHLFLRIILPELRRGYEEHRRSYARWIAQFTDKISSAYRESLEALGFKEFCPDDLLREALRLDPHDAIARTYLINLLAERFRINVHEVPTGALVLQL